MELLEEIDAAFDAVPYPGDEVLTECACEECRGGVSRFVGKDWRTLRFKDAVSDQLDANIRLLAPTAFRYFLPGLMRLALRSHVDADPIATDILDRLTASDRQPVHSRDEAQAALDVLSDDQRRVVVRFLERLRGDETRSPVILDSARTNLETGLVRPYPHQKLEEWVRIYLASLAL